MYHDALIRFTPGFSDRLLAIAQTLDLPPGPGGSRMADVEPCRVAYRAVESLLVWLPTPWQQVTVIALEPSAQIVAHRDAPIRGRRYHLPLDVNSGCWVFHDGVWQQLAVGGMYRMDPALEHGAVNWGTTRRLHLIIDVEKGEEG